LSGARAEATATARTEPEDGLMHPDQLYTLTKLRSAELEEQARRSRRVAGRRPEPLRRSLHTRLARLAAGVRVSRSALTRGNGADVPAGR
jgi:uncharacterized protein YbjT (DUF2867 family)